MNCITNERSKNQTYMIPAHPTVLSAKELGQSGPGRAKIAGAEPVLPSHLQNTSNHPLPVTVNSNSSLSFL